MRKIFQLIVLLMIMITSTIVSFAGFEEDDHNPGMDKAVVKL